MVGGFFTLQMRLVVAHGPPTIDGPPPPYPPLGADRTLLLSWGGQSHWSVIRSKRPS